MISIEARNEEIFLKSSIHHSLRLLIIILFLIILYYSRLIVIISLIGVGIAVLISPILDSLNRRFKIRRSIGAILFILSALIFFGVVGGLFGYVIIDQARSLINRLPEFSILLQARFEGLFDRFPWIQKINHLQNKARLRNC